MRYRILVTLPLGLALTAGCRSPMQARYGINTLFGAVSSRGGLHRNLRCVQSDTIPQLLGRAIVLRDNVVGNVGGWHFMRLLGGGTIGPAEPGDPLAMLVWNTLRIEAGQRLSRCLQLILERMPQFHWVAATLAWTRLAVAEANEELSRLAVSHGLVTRRRGEPVSVGEIKKARERDFESYLSAANRRLSAILRARPGYLLATYYAAEALALQRKWEEAAASFSRVGSGGGDSSHVQSWLGFIAAQRGDKSAAQAAFRRAIELDTDDEASNYARYALGDLDSGNVLDGLRPPHLRESLPRKPALITHFLMRLAILNFVDKTHSAGDLHRIAPDMLATMLVKSGRFEVYDRGQLRNQPHEEANRIADELRSKWLVDAVMTGAITHVDYKAKTIRMEVRVVATHDDVILLARRYGVRFWGSGPEVTDHGHRDSGDNDQAELRVTGNYVPDPRVLERLAKEIQEAFPKVGDGRIIELAPRHVVVSKGARDRVFRGMSAYVEAVNEDLVDPKDPSSHGSSGNYVGELHIFSVEPHKSLGVCFHTDRDTLGRRKPCALRMGDVVRFK